MFIEKYIENPRHIEIQVLGDKHGNVIHLGERECSIQRRNQKVVEEAPSPLLDEATRNAMGAQAVALAQAVGYDSAGTVEFVAGQDKRFYFLEMNTRLQVEHPVTELVTGVDLVEQMIRVAAGEKLVDPPERRELQRLGGRDPHLCRGSRIATSCRRSAGWCATGRRRRAATGGVTVRVDAGVIEGSEISLFYDPMIAKLVTHAPTRERAVAAQADALDAFVIDGIRHNVSFLAALMQNKRWREGRLSTGFIAEEFPGGFRPLVPEARRGQTLAAVAAAIDHVLGERKRRISGQRPDASFDARTPARGAARRQPSLRWTSTARTTAWRCVSAARASGTSSPRTGRRARCCGSGTVDNDPVSVQVRPVPNGFDLMHRGVEVRAYVFTEREAEVARLVPPRTVADGGKAVRCPMPGQVVSLAVAVGPGGQGRRAAGRGRGHEDGERAARRARRRGGEDSCPAGR